MAFRKLLFLGGDGVLQNRPAALPNLSIYINGIFYMTNQSGTLISCAVFETFTTECLS